MAVQFYLYDCEKKVDIAIASSETVIGRDSILQCDDKRISRQHGIIKHDGEQAERTIQITSTHTNPIFLRTDDQVLNILTKDLTATLRHGDKFALLPDQYWFEVRFKNPEAEEAAVSSSSPSTTETAASSELLRVRTMEEVNNVVAEQRVLPDWMNGGGSGEKRKNGDESEAESAKRSRCDEDAKTSSGSGDGAIAVKPDPDAAEAGTSRPKSPSADVDKKDVKKETADSTCSPPGRPSCEFGIRCYRRTLEHRNQFAHPNDNDYRRPTFPPAPSDAPHCPYGVACYRRNPQHFRDFQHPDSSEYKRATVTHAATHQQQVPAAGHRPTVDTDRRRRRRLARDIVIAAMVNPDLFDSDDDADLFGEDSDSDEYRPDRPIDEDDDDEEADEEEEDINFRILNDDENEE